MTKFKQCFFSTLTAAKVAARNMALCGVVPDRSSFVHSDECRNASFCQKSSSPVVLGLEDGRFLGWLRLQTEPYS